jgi:hypothetical protein
VVHLDTPVETDSNVPGRRTASRWRCRPAETGTSGGTVSCPSPG